MIFAGPTFLSFNPCPSLRSVAIDDSKQFQCPDMVLNKKTGALVLKSSSREEEDFNVKNCK